MTHFFSYCNKSLTRGYRTVSYGFAMMLARLFFVIGVVCGRTVKLTNVPPSGSVRGTRTYEIEVPGKPPIRIIEADPVWNHIPTTNRYFTSPEHRGVKFGQKDQATATPVPDLEENSTKIYSPEALNEFLKTYAEKIRENHREDEESTESIATEEQIDRLSDLPLEEDNDTFDDKSKRWGTVGVKKHNHPYEDKTGWVTMEAVPWSSSKIQKWHTNHKYEMKPNDYDSHQEYPTNNYNDYKKPFPNYDVTVRPPYQTSSRPHKPTYGYDQTPIHIKPRPDYPDHSRPTSWERPTPPYNLHVTGKPEPWYHEKKPYISINFEGYPTDEHRDIITDGRPGDFPSRDNSYKRPYDQLQERPTNRPHPSTYPSGGNGEWVLVSTTKGYQYPRPKQSRSLDFSPNSVGTKRSVRLTVLPPDEGSKINMTTSHGGLLEVESTFETVEQQSQKVFSERLQANKTARPVLKIRRRPQKQVQKDLQEPARVQDASRTNHHDPTAVLAAIGAGMVPATMAMLMPLVNGRRRRSLDPVVNVTKVPFIDYELTLPRSY